MVPEGWKLSEVGEHVDLLSGFPFKSADYSDDPSDVRLLRGDNIGQGQLRWRDAKKWDRSQYEELAKYHLEEGDFVIAMDRTWVSGGLKVAEVRKPDLPSLLLQRVSRLRAKDTLDQRLLRYFINSHRFEQYVKSVQTETAVPHISARQIKDFPIPIPPLPEQRKMAEILSTWDRAIETSEALLATARTQKRALMQTLLTGKRRFPEFEGEKWREVLLGDVLEISAGKAKRDVLDEDGDKVVLDMGSVSRSGTVIPKKRTFSNDDILSVGDLVMPKDDIGGGNIIGKVVRVSAENAFVLGDHVYRLRIKPNQEVNSGFLRYVINGPEVNRWFRRKANGTAQLGLGRKEVEKQVVSLPSMDEQNRISEVLFEAETLEADYEAEIEKLRTEKKALMQQLLTGKRRVQV